MANKAKRLKKKKKRILPRVLAGLLILLLLLCGGTGWYVSDYYHADETALAVLESPADGVTVEYGSGDELIFLPDGEIRAGLIFYPGGKVGYRAYAPLMEKLAERGIACVLLKMTCNLAIMDINAADGVQEQFPEITSWVLAGHSLGGTAAAMYLEKHAEEYEGLVLLGAYSSVDLSGTGLSVLSIYGDHDGVLSLDSYEESRSNLPADLTEEVLEGGCHAYYGCYGEQDGDGTASITPEEQQTMTADLISDWIG